MEYLEKYMAPMEEIWEKYKDIEGMQPEKYLWHRVMLSPFYTFGKIKYDVENIAETSLTITTDYLNLYTKLWSETEKADPSYMELLNGRKKDMLKIMLENDPGEGPLKKALGKEKAEKLLALLFLGYLRANLFEISAGAHSCAIHSRLKAAPTVKYVNCNGGSHAEGICRCPHPR